MAVNPKIHSDNNQYNTSHETYSAFSKITTTEKLTKTQRIGSFISAIFKSLFGTITCLIILSKVRKNIANNWHEFYTGTRNITVLADHTPSSRKTSKVVKTVLDIKPSHAQPKEEINNFNPIGIIKNIHIPDVIKPIIPLEHPIPPLTRENLPDRMQDIVSNYYAKPFPHMDDVVVYYAKPLPHIGDVADYYKNKEVLWKNCSPQEKFDIVYEHSLPHNRYKLLQRSNFSSDDAWVEHINDRLFRGSHNADGTPNISFGLENDPKKSHGSDHAIRVGIFSGIYAYLYDKYDPNTKVTPDELLAIQLTGAFHDSGRQTDGVDVDDLKSAKNAKENLHKWGVSQSLVDQSYVAISDKDNPNLSNKHTIAKCIQCADSSEYGRVGSFDIRYLDIYKEFNAPGQKFKDGKNVKEFNQELTAVNAEMAKLMKVTVDPVMRHQLSNKEKNYYNEILKLVTPKDYPLLNAILTQSQLFSSSQIKPETGLFPEMFSEIKALDVALGGTTGAKKGKDTQGNLYVMKKPGKVTAQHLINEYHTNRAYKALGVAVPDVTLYHQTTQQRIKEGQEKTAFSTTMSSPVLVSKFVPDTTKDVQKIFIEHGLNIGNYSTQGVNDLDQWTMKNDPIVKQIQDISKKSFVADCLLANWDVAGLKFDNLKYDETTQTVWRIDNGSGLEYRAQGSPKANNFFTSKIIEFDSFRNPHINKNTTFLFETLTNNDIIQQINDIIPKREAFLATIPDHLKKVMGERFDYMIAYGRKLQGQHAPIEPHKDPASPVNIPTNPGSSTNNFISRVNNDITSLSISELEKGLNDALSKPQRITDPQYKTALFVAAETIAQSYIAQPYVANSFEKAMKIRMNVAEKIAEPGPPLNTLTKTLKNAHPKLGSKLSPIDTWLFKNHSLSVQQRKSEDGTTRLHLDGKLNYPAHARLKKTAKWIIDNSKEFHKLLPKNFCTGVTVSYNHSNTYEMKKAFPIENTSPKSYEERFSAYGGYTLYNNESNTIHFEGVGDVRIWDVNTSSPGTLSLTNKISIDLDPKIPEKEATAKLQIIFAALGMGSVSSSSRPVDEERIKIMQLFRAYFPKQAYAFSREVNNYETSIDKLKENICNSVPEMKHIFTRDLPNMYQQEVYPGQFVWAVKGLADQVKAKGGWGLMAGVGGCGGTNWNTIASILKFGGLSTQDRFEMGMITPGASPTEDFVKGGAGAVFTRLITNKTSKYPNDYFFHGNIQILYDLKLVERGGYAYNDDEYGSKEEHLYKNRGNILDLTENISIRNEVCINNRVPPEFIKGLLVQSHQDKKDLIASLEANGVIEKSFVGGTRYIHGIPVDDFIHVGEFKKEYWT